MSKAGKMGTLGSQDPPPPLSRSSNGGLDGLEHLSQLCQLTPPAVAPIPGYPRTAAKMRPCRGHAVATIQVRDAAVHGSPGGPSIKLNQRSRRLATKIASWDGGNRTLASGEVASRRASGPRARPGVS